MISRNTSEPDLRTRHEQLQNVRALSFQRRDYCPLGFLSLIERRACYAAQIEYAGGSNYAWGG